MTPLAIARLPAGSPLWLLALVLGMPILHVAAAWLVRVRLGRIAKAPRLAAATP
jgi:hypothetical protein